MSRSRLPDGPLELWWLPESNRAGSSNKDHWVVCGVSQAQLDLAWHHVSLTATYFGKHCCLSAPLMGNLKHREKKSLSQNHTQVWPQSLRACAINYTVASKPFLLSSPAPITTHKWNLGNYAYQREPWGRVNAGVHLPQCWRNGKLGISLYIWIFKGGWVGWLAGCLLGWWVG